MRQNPLFLGSWKIGDLHESLVCLHGRAITKPKEKLFKFGRHHARQIINHVTEQWCHWFRSQAESYYGKYVFTTPFALRDFVGVSDIESLGPYVKTDWKDYQERLLGKT